MSFSFLKNSVTPQTPEETLNIWTYELAKVFECFYHLPTFSPGYTQTELADITAMMRLFCEQEDLIAIQEGGELQRFTDYREGLACLYIALGQVVQYYHYSKRFGANSTKGSVQEAIYKFDDTLNSFCHYNFWSYLELLELGEKRYIERMQDLIAKGKQSQLKSEFRRRGKKKNV